MTCRCSTWEENCVEEDVLYSEMHVGFNAMLHFLKSDSAFVSVLLLCFSGLLEAFLGTYCVLHLVLPKCIP